jgi:hypothetical protein
MCLNTKHNKPAYRKGEPLKSKQPKKMTALRQLTMLLMRWNRNFIQLNNFNDFKPDLKGVNGNMQKLNVQPSSDVVTF